MTDQTPDWRDRAECLTADPNLMQPDRATAEDVATAKALCDGCPVRDECRDLATEQRTDHGSAYGVHAGEWYGEAPVWLVERTCELDDCLVVFRTERDGNRQQRFCTPKHRVAAARSREHVA